MSADFGGFPEGRTDHASVVTEDPQRGTHEIYQGLSIQAYISAVPPPGVFELYLEGLSLDWADAVDDICCVPDVDLSSALSCCANGGQKAKLIKYLRAMFANLGFEEPPLGAALPRRTLLQAASKAAKYTA